MKLTFETIYDNLDVFFMANTINLKDVTFCDPWGIGLVCLKAVENANRSDKCLILPDQPEICSYLKRMHFDQLMKELTYGGFLGGLNCISLNERGNLNVHEIMHCSFRDEFAGRLSSKIRLMLRNFGMSDQDEQLVTSLIGELGNNVFDHNGGSWPTDFTGAIIIAQHYPKLKKVQVVVADAGVGFLGSMKAHKPVPKDDLEAIKLGLSGVTGRVGERRGNGLRVIQDWTINKFNGIIMIHSGNGLIVVDKNGQKYRDVNKVLGTLAGIVVSYK